jgi:Spy/CpxP family protein refolding chaperone
MMAAALGLASGLPRAYGIDPADDPAKNADASPHGQWAEHCPLGLSKDQQQKMKDAFKAERETMKPLRRELRDALLKLKDMVEDKASDTDLQAAMDRVAKAKTALHTEKEQFRAKMDGILTASQRAKKLLFRMHHRGDIDRGMACRCKSGEMGCGMRHGGKCGMMGSGQHYEEGQDDPSSPEGIETSAPPERPDEQ